jgi:hypothetical protein
LNRNNRFRLFLTVVLLLGGTGLLYLFFNQFRNSLIDDTFITLRYASTLRNYFEWGFYHGWTSNTATSPLNVVLIALFNIFISDVVSAALLLTAVESVGIIVCLFKLSQHEYHNNLFAMVAAIGTILNPLLLSTIGLESFLFCLLFSCSLLCLITRNPKQLGISLGLLTLTRPEGCLFFAFFLGYYILHQTIHRAKIKTVFQIAVPYIITIAPWFLFSWIHLGSFVPDTLFIKIHQNWGGNILTGISLYFTKFPFETMVAFIFIPIAIVFFRWTKDTFRYLLPSCTIAYLFCYLFLDVPPYHWYYTPIAYISILMGSYGLSVFVLNHKERFGRIVGVMGLIVPLLGFVAVMSFRPTIPLKEAFIYSNWASQNQYRNIAQWLSDSITTTRPIILNGEAGTIAYFCKHQMTNYFTIGIDDSIIVNRFHKISTVSRLCASINHFFWKPQNYQASSEWVIRLNPDHRDTMQLSKDRKHWFLISRFDSAGVGIARLFSTKGNERH